MRRLIVPTLALGLSALPACNRVSGRVDGETVPALEGFFSE